MILPWWSCIKPWLSNALWFFFVCFYLFCVHLEDCGCVCVLWHRCGGQRTTWGRLFNSSTTWVLGMNSGHLFDSKHLYLLSHISAGLYFECLGARCYNLMMLQLIEWPLTCGLCDDYILSSMLISLLAIGIEWLTRTMQVSWGLFWLSFRRISPSSWEGMEAESPISRDRRRSQCE